MAQARGASSTCCAHVCPLTFRSRDVAVSDAGEVILPPPPSPLLLLTVLLPTPPTMSRRASMLSLLHRSSSDKSWSVYWHPTTRRSLGLPMTARARCCRICVNSWCVAATEMLHGSAGRRPMPVENTRGWSPSLRSCFPTWVSHSEATRKMSAVDACIRFAVARGPKVPPLWLTMITMALFRSHESSVMSCPTAGTGKSCPSSPSTLLLDTDRTRSRGMSADRSDANCSPTQRLTSQPVTTTSMAAGGRSPSARFCSRSLSFLARFHPVARLRLLPPFQSS
mmetsp:Transcript_16680/g.41050  ORF Transcript_16680/g.41050 Transcript_16680/m.41050 type:complete len:281 (+) Transcript_16680:1832-2674(+)